MNIRMRGLAQIFILLIGTFCFSQNMNLELLNVRFYQDGGYKSVDRIYVKDGLFTKTKPSRIDSVIDLASKYVVPSLAEGHAHTLDHPDEVDEIVKNYKKEGVHYVWILNNHTSKRAAVEKELQKVGFPNVLFANGGITRSGSHPSLLIEGLNLNIRQHWLPENKEKITKSRISENDAYWFFDSIDMFDEKWENFLKTRPDFVKVYINDISNKLNKGRRTLPIDVLAKIVSGAEKENLRVVAHIETFDDLRTGIDLGIKIYGHLPYYAINFVDSIPDQPTFSKLQLHKIKELQPVVIPTLLLNEEFSTVYEASNGYKPRIDTLSFDRALKFQKETLFTLKEVGFNFAIGSDRSSVVSEIQYWFENEIFIPKEILTAATNTTSKLMYPDRKINRIEEGFEANFIVLNGNPISDWKFLKDIEFRVFVGRLE